MYKIKRIKYHICDIDCDILVEVSPTIKGIWDFLEEYLDNLNYDWFDASDQAFSILYMDGHMESITENYDGHKIKRRGIKSIVYDNPCTSIVYGPYHINRYGVVSVGEEMDIDENIIVV